MGKLFLLIFGILFLSAASFAQGLSNKKVTLEVQTGATFSRFRDGISTQRIPMNGTLSNNYVTFDAYQEYSSSFYIAGAVNIPIVTSSLKGGKLVLQPGLSFVGKGGKTILRPNASAAHVYGDGAITLNTTLSYLEIPVNILSYHKLGSGKFFLGGGFSFGILLDGTIDRTAESTIASKFDLPSEDVSIGSGENDLHRIDLSNNLLLGYQLNNGLGVRTGFSFSLLNIRGEGVQQDLANMGFNVGVTYRFKAKS